MVWGLISFQFKPAPPKLTAGINPEYFQKLTLEMHLGDLIIEIIL